MGWGVGACPYHLVTLLGKKGSSALNSARWPKHDTWHWTEEMGGGSVVNVLIAQGRTPRATQGPWTLHRDLDWKQSEPAGVMGGRLCSDRRVGRPLVSTEGCDQLV